jgi:RNA-binding protein with serine-rich domain 1
LLFPVNFRRSRSRSFSPDSSDFGNSPIKNVRSPPSPTRSPSPSKSPSRNSSPYLAIGNLTRNVNEGHLREIFGFYGEIVAVVYPMHPNTGYPVGKAVIQYKEMVSVENALKGMHGGQIDGNVIDCNVSKYPEPFVKSNRGVRESRHRENRSIRGRIDHYVPAGRRRNRSRTPVRRSRSPIRRRFSPDRKFRRRSPSRSPMRKVSRSPRRISRSPARRYSRSPIRRVSRSPRRFSRSPIRRDSRTPRRFSRSPVRRFSRSRSPVRKFSRSPIRRSPSPRNRRRPRPSISRSPIRRRSPSHSRSRSPPRYRRHDGPPRQIDRSPRRFSPRRSPSRSPIPVSRMKY